MEPSTEVVNYAHGSPIFSAIIMTLLGLVFLVLIIGAAAAIKTVFHAYRAAVQYLQDKPADTVESLMQITAMYARLNKIIGRERTSIEDEQFTYSTALYIAHEACLHEQESVCAEKAVNAYPDNAFFQHARLYALMSQEKWQQAATTLEAYTESYSDNSLSIQVQQYVGEFEQAIATKTVPAKVGDMLYGETGAKALTQFRKRAKIQRIYTPIIATITSLILLASILMSVLLPDK